MEDCRVCRSLAFTQNRATWVIPSHLHLLCINHVIPQESYNIVQCVRFCVLREILHHLKHSVTVRLIML